MVIWASILKPISHLSQAKAYSPSQVMKILKPIAHLGQVKAENLSQVMI